MVKHMTKTIIENNEYVCKQGISLLKGYPIVGGSRHGETCNDVVNDTFDWLVSLLDEDSVEYNNAFKEYTRNKTRQNYGKLQYAKKPYYLCAYNGANFDFMWLFQYFKRNGLQSKFGSRKESVCWKGNTAVVYIIYEKINIRKDIFSELNDNMNSDDEIECNENGEEIEYHRAILKCHDLCQILTCSLDDASKSYLCDDRLEKYVFPHFALNREGLDLFNEETIHITLDDFPEDKRDHVKQLIRDGILDLSHYNILGELYKYAPLDVNILVEVYKKVNEQCFKLFECPVLSFCTANNMTDYASLYNLEPKFCHYISYDKNPHAKPESKYKAKITKLYKLDKEMETFIRDRDHGGIEGGKVYPRTLKYESKEQMIL